MQEQKYVVNEQGEKVIPASRRPDGTWRKERKVKEGYVPQDEAKAYVSRGSQFQQDQRRVPGAPPVAAGATLAAAAAKSKAAKKNEKRKQKRQQEGDDVSMAAAQLQATSISSPAPISARVHDENGAAADAGATAEDPISKKVKALRKKVRQCQVLLQAQAERKSLTPEEQGKLSRMAAWEAEIRELEEQQ